MQFISYTSLLFESVTHMAAPTPTASEQALQHCHPSLAQYIDFDAIFPHLVQFGLLSRDQQEVLDELPATRRAKVRKVLHWLPESGPEFLGKFIQSLKDTAVSAPHHEVLAEELQKAFAEFQAKTGTNAVLIDETVGPGVVSEDRHPLMPEDQDPSYFRKCIRKLKRSYRWLCYYLCLTVTIILLVCTLAILASVPSAQDRVTPACVYNGITVELKFKLDTAWINEITMILVGTGCRGPVIVIEGIPCKEFSKTHASNYTLDKRYANFIYMLKGSTIHFTIDSDADTQVWIFSDYASADAYSGDKDIYRCSHYPPGAYCFEAGDYSNTTFDYTIERPSYYFIRLRRNTGGINWRFDIKYYNYETLLSSGYKPEVTLSADPQTIHLYPQPFRYIPSCVLLYIEDGSCPEYAEPQVTSMKRRQDVLVFPGVLLLATVSAIVVPSILHCLRVYRTRYRTL